MQMLQIVLAALATGAATMTVSKAKVFKDLQARLYPPSGLGPRAFLWKLWTCPFCTSHWLALLTTLVFKLRVLHCGLRWVGPAAEVVATVFVLVALSAPVCAGIFHLHAGIPKTPEPK